jgi:hypothetical protein
MLYGLKVIAAHLGTTPHVVKQLRREGAPVRVLRRGRKRDGLRYLADSDALSRWLQHAD